MGIAIVPTFRDLWINNVTTNEFFRDTGRKDILIIKNYYRLLGAIR